jgi:hypothetical protein
MQEITRKNYKKLLRRKGVDVDVRIDFREGSNTDFESITFYFTNGTGDTKKLFIDKLDKIELALEDLQAIKLQPEKVVSIPNMK